MSGPATHDRTATRPRALARTAGVFYVLQGAASAFGAIHVVIGEPVLLPWLLIAGLNPWRWPRQALEM